MRTMGDKPGPALIVKSVAEVLSALRRRRLVIPQRAWRWDERTVLRFFDSMLRGYPIGMLIVWQAETGVDRVRWVPEGPHARQGPWRAARPRGGRSAAARGL